MKQIRDIKFCGKRIDNGIWVYGHYFTTPLTDENSGTTPDAGWYFLTGGSRHCIGQNGVAFVVDPETVGQYAELKDKHGKEIYENDDLRVVEVSNHGTLEYVSKVEYVESGFQVTQPDGCVVPLACFHNLESSYPLFEIEVVGGRT